MAETTSLAESNGIHPPRIDAEQRGFFQTGLHTAPIGVHPRRKTGFRD